MTLCEQMLKTFEYVRDEIESQFRKMSQRTLFTSQYGKQELAHDFRDGINNLKYDYKNEPELQRKVFSITCDIADFIRGFGSIVVLYDDLSIETLFSSLDKWQGVNNDIIDIFLQLDRELKECEIRNYYVCNIKSLNRYMKFIRIPIEEYYNSSARKWLRDKETIYNRIHKWLDTVQPEEVSTVRNFFSLYTDIDYIEFFENRSIDMKTKYTTIKDLHNLYKNYRTTYSPSRCIWYFLDKFLKHRNPYFENFMPKFYGVNTANVIDIFLPPTYNMNTKNKLIQILNSLQKNEIQAVMYEMVSRESFGIEPLFFSSYYFKFTIIDYMYMGTTLLQQICDKYKYIAIPKYILKARQALHDDSIAKEHLINLITAQLKDKTVDELKQMAYKG